MIYCTHKWSTRLPNPRWCMHSLYIPMVYVWSMTSPPWVAWFWGQHSIAVLALRPSLNTRKTCRKQLPRDPHTASFLSPPCSGLFLPLPSCLWIHAIDFCVGSSFAIAFAFEEEKVSKALSSVSYTSAYKNGVHQTLNHCTKQQLLGDDVMWWLVSTCTSALYGAAITVRLTFCLVRYM